MTVFFPSSASWVQDVEQWIEDHFICYTEIETADRNNGQWSVTFKV